jgi:hypothetical protein
MKKLITICAAVTTILVLGGAVQAAVQTYSIVDYPAGQIDTMTGLADHISGTITADTTTGVIYFASFTITGATSYTVASAAIDPYYVHITPTQIILTQTNPSNPLGYGNLRLSGSTGVSGANSSAVVQWYVPGNPWVVGSYPYTAYMGTVGSKGSGPLFAGGLGDYPWVVATVIPEQTPTTAAALPVTNSVGSADYAPGFAPGSWQASATVAGQKSEYYISPQALFGRDVNIGELSSISYFTKKNTTHTVNTADWYINIYTKPDANLPIHGSWYGNRIGSEPYFSQNLLDPCNTWNQWVTGAGQNNRLRFFDSTNNLYFGSYTDGFLSDLTANAAYKNQKILSFSVQTGSAWANGFTGLVDGLKIKLTDESVGQVNFVATSYCPDTLAGDLNGDCQVNFEDLKILASQWLQPPGSPSADIAPSPSGDGIVNFSDFAVMADNWLKCDLLPQSSCP